MIFTPQHIEKIVTGMKTETRRIVKPGEWSPVDGSHYVASATGRLKWLVGRNYAVQPGRGKPCHIHNELPLRIEILSIHRAPLQSITREGAIAEGVGGLSPVGDYRNLWETINGAGSWDKNPVVWVIKFEVLRQGND